MSDLHQDPAQESCEGESPLTVEISRLAPPRPDESVPAARLSLRARTGRLVLVAGTFLVLLVVVLCSLPALRNQAGDALQCLFPTPTPTLLPGADRFAFETDVPWSTVSLDGHPLAVPHVGVSAPLRLSRGEHTLTWTAQPFQPQRCTLLIPDPYASTCAVIEEALSGTGKASTAVVYLHESLASLSATERQALIQTAQAALSGYSEPVLPGEWYLGGGMATEPLRATLKMQVQTDDTGGQGCWFNVFSGGDCTLDGIACLQFCTVPWPVRLVEKSSLAAIQEEWLVLAVEQSSWDYATLDGRTIASDQPIDSGGAAGVGQPVLLRIGWDGRQWQVRPLFGPAQGPPITGDDGLQVTDDPGCLAAEDIFHEEIGSYASVRFVSGPNPAAGCLVEATLASQAQTPTPAGPQVEEYLVRFGIMVTVNTLAHLRLMQWPQADAYEQQLARQLATLPGGLTATLVA